MARVLRNPVAPARAVLDRIRLSRGWRTLMEVMARIRPQARDCMPGTAALHMATTDSRLREMASE